MVDIEKLRKKLAQSKQESQWSNNTSNQNVKWYSIKVGRNTVRILPPKDGAEDFYSEVYVHYNLGTDGRKQIVCPNHMKGEPCPVCELVDELFKGDQEDIKQARKLKAKKKYYYNVLDTSLDENDENFGEVMVMSTGVTIFEDILSIICDPDFGDITDPDTGRDLIINRSGKSLNTEYKVNARPKQTEVEYEFEDGLYDLSVWGNPRSYDDIAYFLEHGELPQKSDNNEEKEESQPKPRRRVKTVEEIKQEADEDPFDVSDIDDVDDDLDPFDIGDDDDDDDEDEIEAEIERILKRKRNS